MSDPLRRRTQAIPSPRPLVAHHKKPNVLPESQFCFFAIRDHLCSLDEKGSPNLWVWKQQDRGGPVTDSAGFARHVYGAAFEMTAVNRPRSSRSERLVGSPQIILKAGPRLSNYHLATFARMKGIISCKYMLIDNLVAGDGIELLKRTDSN